MHRLPHTQGLFLVLAIPVQDFLQMVFPGNVLVQDGMDCLADITGKVL